MNPKMSISAAANSSSDADPSRLSSSTSGAPCPTDDDLRALVFDSVYDTFRGVVSYVRLFSGRIKRGTVIRMLSTDKTYEVKEVGVFTPRMTKLDELLPGDVGYLIANMKSATEVKIGDTITERDRPCPEALPGPAPARARTSPAVAARDRQTLRSLWENALGAASTAVRLATLLHRWRDPRPVPPRRRPGTPRRRGRCR